MKLYSNLIFFVSITVLTLVGCNHETDGVSPARVLGPDAPLDTCVVSLFRLPTPAPGGITNLSESRLVMPGRATVFFARLGYTRLDGRDFSADARFTVPVGAVSDTVTITISLDTVHAAIHFKPAGLRFLAPASLDVSLTNLDPFADQSIVKFMYENPTGPYEFEDFESMIVTGSGGKIMMQKGRVPHFSRYVFGRRHGQERLE